MLTTSAVDNISNARPTAVTFIKKSITQESLCEKVQVTISQDARDYL